MKLGELSVVSSGGAETIDVAGGVVSIRNGPRCDVPLQLPETFSVRRWNHHEPSGRNDDKAVVVSSAVFVASGSVSELADHTYE